MTHHGGRVRNAMRRPLVLASSVLVLVSAMGISIQIAAAQSCANPVACENQLPGTLPSVWDSGPNSGDPTLQGFATSISVQAGQTISFKITTSAPAYQINIYRFGYYGGDGARFIASVPPGPAPQNQPPCLTDPSTGNTDCGNWAVSTSWTVPTSAVSGVYEAHLVRPDTGGDSQILFVVTNPSSHSDVLFKVDDAAWEAYNTYGGNDLYTGTAPAGRAYAVSYNRPLTTRGSSDEDSFFNAEFPMIEWMEENGYDVSYTTDVDTDADGASVIEQHKVFMDAGHDEYWSANERANVTAARDAGVNLAFFSGNEIFWKTRYAPSIDGSNTASRTLICYKETKAGAAIDPADPPISTASWMDPRFGPPVADGGDPQNALTGQLYMVNGIRNDAITVPSALKNLRIWRNTSIANLASGSSVTFPQGTLGYEWDEDVDNGYRPAGEFDLSSTTINLTAGSGVGATSDDGAGYLLQDYGNTYGFGNATHSLTLYRAASGALVFGAGTVQWSWGLDSRHDTPYGVPDEPADPDMQQATVNLLADMGVQPTTLQAGLVPATGSSDTTPPTSTITSPSPETNLTAGVPVTVTGTATDAGGGVVAGVEVTTNGGHWHPATMSPAATTVTWQYTFTPGNAGPLAIESRAVDDSGNLETPTDATQVTILDQTCPCSLWSPSATPGVTDSGDPSAVELGVKFTSDQSGTISGIRFYKAAANIGTHTGDLWSSTGQLLATTTFTSESASGWQQASFSAPVNVTAGATYVAAYHTSTGHYAADRNYFNPVTPANYFGTGGYDDAPLHALSGATSGGNGVYAYASTDTFPISSYQDTNYWVDVVFVPGVAQNVPPEVASNTPVSNATGVSTDVAPTATFNKAVQPTSIQMGMSSTSGPTNGSVGYNANTNTATFTPSQALTPGATYTVSVTAAVDLSGNSLSGPDSWSFTTSPPQACGCSLWGPTVTPSTIDSNDANAVEVGVRFTTDTPGTISGIRFYKALANTGTHVGDLWSSAGKLLATATFSSETASGWQQVNFATAVPVTPGTTYVAAYHTNVGHYSDNSNYFTNSYDVSPLHAPASTASAGNGVYHYGSTDVFPSSTYHSTNYWVDVVFEPNLAPPTVVSTTPEANSAGASADTLATATFSEAIQPSSLSMSLMGPSGAVSGTVSYNSASDSGIFTPAAPLSPGTTYTATVGAAKDNFGNTMTGPVSWSFTVAAVQSCTVTCSLWGQSATPGTPDSGDGKAVEVGVKFTVDVPGTITGISFYKAAANTGIHQADLWSSAGQLLASATYTAETASGWQLVTFATPVPVSPGTTYVAAYHTNVGHYSADNNYFARGYDNSPLHSPAGTASAGNGVYHYGSTDAFPNSTYRATNYWVDVAFTSNS